MVRPQDCKTVVLNCLRAGTKLGLAMGNDFEQTMVTVTNVAVRNVCNQPCNGTAKFRSNHVGVATAGETLAGGVKATV
jgi:hypothetical protein